MSGLRRRRLTEVVRVVCAARQAADFERVRAQGDVAFDPAVAAAAEPDDETAHAKFDEHEEEMIAARGGLRPPVATPSDAAYARRYGAGVTPSSAGRAGYDSLPGVGTTSTYVAEHTPVIDPYRSSGVSHDPGCDSRSRH